MTRISTALWLSMVALPLLLAGCSRSPIEQAEDQFVSGCHAQGAAKAMCRCMFGKLTAHYGERRMLALEQAGVSALPPDFASTLGSSVLSCRA